MWLPRRHEPLFPATLPKPSYSNLQVVLSLMAGSFRVKTFAFSLRNLINSTTLGLLTGKANVTGKLLRRISIPNYLELLEQLSFKISRTTFIVLDNARIHKTKDSRQRIPYWQKRGLFLFFLPPYSPHLNIAETLWRELKKEWLDPKDYLSKDTLGYALNRCMADMGNGTNIKFSHFNAN